MTFDAPVIPPKPVFHEQSCWFQMDPVDTLIVYCLQNFFQSLNWYAFRGFVVLPLDFFLAGQGCDVIRGREGLDLTRRYCVGLVGERARAG